MPPGAAKSARCGSSSSFVTTTISSTLAARTASRTYHSIGSAAQLVQHLRTRALHARSLTGGEDDRARAHGFAPTRSRAERSLRQVLCSALLTPPSTSSATRKRSRQISRPKISMASKRGTDVGLPVMRDVVHAREIPELATEHFGNVFKDALDHSLVEFALVVEVPHSKGQRLASRFQIDFAFDEVFVLHRQAAGEEKRHQQAQVA